MTFLSRFVNSLFVNIAEKLVHDSRINGQNAPNSISNGDPHRQRSEGEGEIDRTNLLTQSEANTLTIIFEVT